jgi:integrase/recombinase XerD
MPPGAVNDLLARLEKRAGLTRHVKPHMCRQAMAATSLDAGATLDEAQELLRHAQASSAVYMHPSAQRHRAAVERVPSPRLSEDGQR